jgi:predicted dehydrogenase
MEDGFQVSVVQTCEARLSGVLSGIVIHGDRGSLHASQEGGCDIFGDGPEPRHLDYPEAPLSDYAQEMEAFADYVAGTAEGPTTARSERRSLAIVQAGYESSRSGEPVNLKTRFGDL